MSEYNVTHNLGKNYWQNNLGYITKDRATIGLLSKERSSVNKLFDVIVSQAFTRPIDVRREDGTYEFWDIGSRKWGLRGLAEAAGMSINTVRYGLNRLKEIGLIKRLSNKLGTIIQALRFYQYRRKNPNVTPFIKDPTLTQGGDTRVSENDPYRCDSNSIINKLSNTVDVQSPIEKETQPLEDFVLPGSDLVARLLAEARQKFGFSAKTV